MCGRFTLTVSVEAFITELGSLVAEFLPEPRYNVAPGQPVATVLNDGRRAVTATRWGLIPSWAREAAIANRMINARAESLVEKPAFRDAVRTRRCLILADGFYEWKKVPGRPAKQPVYFRLAGGRPFGFAGLWDTWNDPERGPIVTSTIITTAPNALVAGYHDRMPAILLPEHVQRWIDPADAQPADLAPCFAPYPASAMEVWNVSTMVNNAKADHPDMVRPFQDPQADLFG